MRLIDRKLIFVVGLLIFIWPIYSQAQTEPFFALSPAQKEISLSPGEEVFVPLTIINHLGKTAVFNITIEDIGPAPRPEEVIEIVDGQDGPYSLKNFISFTDRNVTLLDGEEKTISFSISLPKNVPPGSLHGGIFVNSTDTKSGNVKTISRIGSLLFIKVKGDIKESGSLKDFFIIKTPFWSRPGLIHFQMSFVNDGNSYLNPYGVIEITNLFGRTVKQIPINPWFVLPQSERLRDVETKLSGLGLYTATVSLNRGYGDVVDSKTLRFWSTPWPIIVIIFLILISLIVFIIRLKKKSYD